MGQEISQCSLFIKDKLLNKLTDMQTEQYTMSEQNFVPVAENTSVYARDRSCWLNLECCRRIIHLVQFSQINTVVLNSSGLNKTINLKIN